MTLLSVFEAAYSERVASIGKPTGALVSPALWSELLNSGKIVMTPAQARLSGSAVLEFLPPLPVDEPLPVYQGTIIQVDPALSDDGEFSLSQR